LLNSFILGESLQLGDLGWESKKGSVGGAVVGRLDGVDMTIADLINNTGNNTFTTITRSTSVAVDLLN
jgi:hypothetical protein